MLRQSNACKRSVQRGASMFLTLLLPAIADQLLSWSVIVETKVRALAAARSMTNNLMTDLLKSERLDIW